MEAINLKVEEELILLHEEISLGEVELLEVIGQEITSRGVEALHEPKVRERLLSVIGVANHETPESVEEEGD